MRIDQRPAGNELDAPAVHQRYVQERLRVLVGLGLRESDSSHRSYRGARAIREIFLTGLPSEKIGRFAQFRSIGTYPTRAREYRR